MVEGFPSKLETGFPLIFTGRVGTELTQGTLRFPFSFVKDCSLLFGRLKFFLNFFEYYDTPKIKTIFELVLVN